MFSVKERLLALIDGIPDDREFISASVDHHSDVARIGHDGISANIRSAVITLEWVNEADGSFKKVNT